MSPHPSSKWDGWKKTPSLKWFSLFCLKLICLSSWDYAVVSSVYLINRLPNPVLNGDIPYQKLFSKIPDYKFLKVFGCSWFPLLCPYNTYKFEPRSQKCIFLGYSMSHKGYRCLAANGRLYISKDVFFNEDRFPYTDLFFPPKPTSSPSTPTNPISVFTYTYSTSCCHHLNSVSSFCFPFSNCTFTYITSTFTYIASTLPWSGFL